MEYPHGIPMVSPHVPHETTRSIGMAPVRLLRCPLVEVILEAGFLDQKSWMLFSGAKWQCVKTLYPW